MTYSPGHDSASAVTRFFAASSVCEASTKRGLPSPRNLRMQKGRPNQTPRTIYKGAVGRLSHQFGVLDSRPSCVAHRACFTIQGYAAMMLLLLASFVVVFPSTDLSAAAGNRFLGRYQS